MPLRAPENLDTLRICSRREDGTLSTSLGFSQDDFCLLSISRVGITVMSLALCSLIIHSLKPLAVTVTCPVHITSIATLCLTGQRSTVQLERLVVFYLTRLTQTPSDLHQWIIYLFSLYCKDWFQPWNHNLLSYRWFTGTCPSLLTVFRAHPSQCNWNTRQTVSSLYLSTNTLGGFYTSIHLLCSQWVWESNWGGKVTHTHLCIRSIACKLIRSLKSQTWCWSLCRMLAMWHFPV